jgi:hypothetical protein
MKKKFFSLFLITLILLATLLPIGSAFAYTGGLLNGLSLTRADSIDGTVFGSIPLFTDNDTSTGATIGATGTANDTIYYKFPSPVTIDTYYVWSSLSSSLQIYYYDSAKKPIGSVIGLANNTKRIPPIGAVSNVTYVALYNPTSSGITVNEFDVFDSSFNGDVLSGKTMFFGSTYNVTTNPTTLVTDNNVSTFVLSSGSNTFLNTTFDSPYVSIGSIYVDGTATDLKYSVILYTMSGNSTVITNSNINKQVIKLDKVYTDVTRIAFRNTSGSDIKFNEVKAFSDSSGVIAPPVKTDVTNVDVTGINKTGASVSWVNPTGYSGVTYKGAKIYVNDVLKTTTNSDSESYSLTGLQPFSNYSVRVTASYSDGTETTGLTKTFKTNSLSEITNLKDTIDYKTAKFTWINPIENESEFNGVKIYRNDVLITTLDKTINDYTETITPSTTYTYKFVATYSGGVETNGVTKTINTDPLPPPKKVINVNVSATYNKVNLSWNLPEQEGLKHVNIYRVKTEKKPGFFESLFSLSGTKVYAAESDKIFETNGTYFNDFTVQPESEYEYTLTTQTDDGRESEGVKVIAETKKEPEPVLVDDGYTVEPTNGDYTFKWSEPTTGTVKVLVNGSHYKTVEASKKQIVIPNGDMKYTILGDPDISLVPISPYGKEGNKVTNPGGLINSLKLPFDVTDLLQTIMGIIGLFAPFILLTLVIYYFKPIKNLIVRAAHRIRNGDVRNE